MNALSAWQGHIYLLVSRCKPIPCCFILGFNCPRNQGALEDAEPLCIQATAIMERALGAEHLDVAHALNDRGMLLVAQVNAETEYP